MQKKPQSLQATPRGRVSFPHLDKPHSGFENQDATYNFDLIFPKSADLTKLKAMAKEAMIKKWGDQVPSSLRSPFRDGDEKEYDGYKGGTYIKLKSKRLPRLIDGKKDPIEGVAFYSGCHAIAAVTCYAYDKMGNKGISFGLSGVQFVGHDQPFGGGGGDPTSVFDEVEDSIENPFGEDGTIGEEDLPF